MTEQELNSHDALVEAVRVASYLHDEEEARRRAVGDTLESAETAGALWRAQRDLAEPTDQGGKR